MYRFRSIKYLTMTGIITALLFVVGYSSSLLFTNIIAKVFGTNNSALQLFDCLFIPFCAFFDGPMLLFAGPIAGAFFDLAAGFPVAIPATIIIRILMFTGIKVLRTKYWWDVFFRFLIAVIIFTTLYPLYYLVIFNAATAYGELLTDLIQAGFAYLVSLLVFFSLIKIRQKSTHWNWDDHQFDDLKPEKNFWNKLKINRKHTTK